MGAPWSAVATACDSARAASIVFLLRPGWDERVLRPRACCELPYGSQVETGGKKHKSEVSNPVRTECGNVVVAKTKTKSGRGQVIRKPGSSGVESEIERGHFLKKCRVQIL